MLLKSPRVSQSPPRGSEYLPSSLEPILGGSSALKCDACAQKLAAWNTAAGATGATGAAEMVARSAARSPSPHAPGARMTVVTLTPSNSGETGGRVKIAGIFLYDFFFCHPPKQKATPQISPPEDTFHSFPIPSQYSQALASGLALDFGCVFAAFGLPSTRHFEDRSKCRAHSCLPGCCGGSIRNSETHMPSVCAAPVFTTPWGA